MATASTLMTAEELDALPENGTDRWLIAGELKERPMTKRNRDHASITATVAMLLGVWLGKQPRPRGRVLAGEAGVILARDPDTSVGIDVTYISAELLARQSDATTMIDGVPTLAVEILSPSDTIEDVNEKIDVYLQVRVPHIWIIDPHRRTVTVHRPEARPLLLNIGDEIAAESDLPGFRAAVKDFFE
jgi:Uma2 family endonuclease